MPPSTLTQVVIFVALLLPGMAHVAVRERRWPERRLSTSREVIRLIYVSVVVDAAVLVAFALVRALGPGLTPDVGALVREPATYLREHYASVLWWGGGLLLVATALAAFVASERATRLATRVPLVRHIIPVEPHPSGVSGWWLAFNEHPGLDVVVECALEDGSSVRGLLRSYTASEDDSADRDLVLVAAGGRPLCRRPPGSHELEQLGAGELVISARRILTIQVTYEESDHASRPLTG